MSGTFPDSYITMNKSVVFSRRKPQIRNPKSETNSKFEFKNVQNAKDFKKYGCSCFDHLSFENLVIVSDFDIRISDLTSARKNTNLTTDGLSSSPGLQVRDIDSPDKEFDPCKTKLHQRHLVCFDLF